MMGIIAGMIFLIFGHPVCGVICILCGILLEN